MAETSGPVRTSISIGHLLNSTTDSTGSDAASQPRQPSPSRSETSDVIELGVFESDENLLQLAHEAAIASKHTANCVELNPTMVIGTIPRTAATTNKVHNYCVRAVVDVTTGLRCFTICRALDGTELPAIVEYPSVKFNDIRRQGRFVGRFGEWKWTRDEIKDFVADQAPPELPSPRLRSQTQDSDILDSSMREWAETRPRRKHGETFLPEPRAESGDRSPLLKARRTTKHRASSESSSLSALYVETPEPLEQPSHSTARPPPLKPGEASTAARHQTSPPLVTPSSYHISADSGGQRSRTFTGDSENASPPPPRLRSMSIQDLWDSHRLHFEVKLAGYDIPFFFELGEIHTTEDLFAAFEREIGCGQARRLRPEVMVSCEPPEVAPMNTFAILRANPRGFKNLESYVSRIWWDRIKECKIIFNLHLQE